MRFLYVPLGKLTEEEKTETGTEKRDWQVLKCFYEEGDAYGEFFLQLDRQNGVGKFAIKDPFYADFLVAAFKRAMEG